MNAARKVEEYFLQIYGMPSDHIRSYFDDPRSSIDITKDIYTWLGMFKGEVRDLIIYYIGHAKHTTTNRQLYLAIKDTQKFDPEGTSLRVESLMRAIKARPSRHYYIFDCCFAAAAIANLQGPSEKELLENVLEEVKLERQGLAALFSSGRAEASVVLPDQENTFFSEALLEALQNISPTSDSPRSFAAVYPEINRYLEVLYQQYRFYTDVQKPPEAHLYSGNLSNIPIFPSRKRTISDPSPQSPKLKLDNIQQVTQLLGHESGVTTLACSPDSQILISGDQEGKVKIWDIAKKTSFIPKIPFLVSVANYSINPIKNLFTQNSFYGPNPVTCLIFHPEGRTFLASWGYGRIKLWECTTGELLKSMQASHRSGVEALAVSPDGLIMISAGWAEKGF